MGARPEDYARLAPYKSFIHVDEFDGPEQLAEYLLELDRDDKKYNEYFQVPQQYVLKFHMIFCSGRIQENSLTQGSSVEYVPCYTTQKCGPQSRVTMGI